jgi:hypothetical protein
MAKSMSVPNNSKGMFNVLPKVSIFDNYKLYHWMFTISLCELILKIDRDLAILENGDFYEKFY